MPLQMSGVPNAIPHAKQGAAFTGGAHDTSLDAGGNKAAVYTGTQSRGGAADEASAGTPRPDGPKATDQQLEMLGQAFAGRHTGG